MRQQPPRYIDSICPSHVCKLSKAIYGLKQAPRSWNNALKATLQAWGFVNSQADTSLFRLRTGTSILLLLVYVDDVILTRNDTQLADKIVHLLDTTFALKDLGQLNYFLGLQVHYLPSGILLNQKKYIADLLHKLNWSGLNPALSPSIMGKKLTLTDGVPLPDPFTYRSTIGALQYLTHTRPDISYIVNHLSQFLKAPTDVHWLAVKRVLCYLVGTSRHGLLIQQSSGLDITTFSDADCACPSRHTVYSLVILSFHGPPKSKLWLLDQALSLSIGP